MSTRAASVVFSARPQSVFAWQEPRASFTGAGSTALTLARARVWRATYRARHSTDKKVSPSFHLPLQKGASSHAVVTSSSSSASPHEKLKKNSLAHRSRVPDPVVESSVAFSLVAFSSLAYLGRHARRDGCVEGDHLINLNLLLLPVLRVATDDASRMPAERRWAACAYVFLVTCRMSD